LLSRSAITKCARRHSSCAARAAASAMSTPDPNWGPIRLVKFGANAARVGPATDHGRIFSVSGMKRTESPCRPGWVSARASLACQVLVLMAGGPAYRVVARAGVRDGVGDRGHDAGASGCCLSGRRADRPAGQQAKPGCRGENEPAEPPAPVRRRSFFPVGAGDRSSCYGRARCREQGP
jgi:hypothetical protein